jgi:hypothetical protein
LDVNGLVKVELRLTFGGPSNSGLISVTLRERGLLCWDVFFSLVPKRRPIIKLAMQTTTDGRNPDGRTVGIAKIA